MRQEIGLPTGKQSLRIVVYDLNDEHVRGIEVPVRDALISLYFDLAGAPIPELLDVLLRVADHNRIHFGSECVHPT
jgi:hypothetical protein